MSPLSALPVTTLDGRQRSFGELTGGKAVLVVNVASRCGLTPQGCRALPPADVARRARDRGGH
jgi:glutathione peroxidase-family protein